MDVNNQFKNDFKYFKRKCPPVDYSKVLDFSNIKEESGIKRLRAMNPSDFPSYDVLRVDFLKPPSEWNIYEVSNIPGLMFISNPFTAAGQRYWIHQCLNVYSRRPNRLNIDIHDVLDKSQEWWESCQGEDPQKMSLKRKLRWATMGYHHNWETKIYSEDEKDPFPTDLAELSRYVSCVVGLSQDFSAEAAIVNFYHFDSTLSGHTDHSEMDLSAPLFSFSFGQTAIFLIGGTSLSCASTPMYIKSGDIVIMSGFSRQCYHGIPKIVAATETPWGALEDMSTTDEMKEKGNSNSSEDSPSHHPCKRSRTDSADVQLSDEKSIMRQLFDVEFWKPYQSYIAHSRINMNVRQVLCKDKKLLNNSKK